MFENGLGVAADAERGEVGAQGWLGQLYQDGESVPQDDREAVHWVELAAQQGDSTAQRHLATFYFRGRAVPTNYVQAYTWSQLAGARGDQPASKFRDFVAKEMTPEQLAEAQRRVREWKSVIVTPKP